MSIIKILPENLVNQIAAGEVIERPASVVKELLENSIDAGSNRITLEITGAGDEMIRITDNGHGMDKQDALLAFERHATSKIESADDLFSIKTMGFRGEAIASIASVSHVTLITKRKDCETGTKVVCNAGKIEKIEECGFQNGTQMEVRNLFFNTPARKKYLKAPSTEYQHILGAFQEMTLAHPEVHFAIIHDDTTSFEYPKNQNLLDRIQCVLGKHVAENCIPISYESEEIKINGYIGKPEISRSGSKHQHLFVNKRYINHPLFGYALSESYHSLLMHGKKPFYLINISIDPSLIDVNVHPRKLEVRFINQSRVFAILQKIASGSLEKNNLTADFGFFDNQTEDQTTERPNRYFIPQRNDNTVNRAINFTREFTADSGQTFMPGRVNKYSYKQNNLDEISMVPLAQIAKSYILAENSDGLVLIDQHAAHERVKYEEFMNHIELENPPQQKLLVPETFELSLAETDILLNNLDIFAQLGFEIEQFGGNTFIIHAVPVAIAKGNIKQIVSNVISDLAEEKKAGNSIKNPQEKIIEYMACRSAIKFGHDLSIDEMAGLIRQLDSLKRPYTCPHGRPSMINLTFEELEKRFKRRL